MRVLIQRVKYSSCTIDGKVTGKTDKGFMLLIGFKTTDTLAELEKCQKKVFGMRIFEDENGKMNISPKDAGASLLIVSQFTLFADCSSRRPGFTDAARPEISKPLYEMVVEECRARGFEVQTGEFGADMKVESINDGPVTIVLDV